MKAFSKLSIRTQILVIGAILLAVIPILSVLVFRQSSEVIVNQNMHYNLELVSTLKQRISDNYTELSSIMINLGYDITVQDFLAETDPLKIYELSKKIQSLMGVIKSTQPDIVDIIVVNDSGKHISLRSKVSVTQNMGSQLKDAGGDVRYVKYKKADAFLTEDSFIFGMNLFAARDTHRYGEQIGFIAVILDAKSIQTEMEKFPRLSGTSIYLLTNDELVFAHESSLKLDVIKNNLKQFSNYKEQGTIESINFEPYAIQSFSLPEINGHIISAVPVNNLIKELEGLKRVSTFMIILTIILITIPYSILMFNILKPLGNLMSFMKRLKTGNLDALNSKVELEGYAEIKVISTQFNTMLDRINELTMQLLNTTSELYQADIERQRAEMLFLQSQINPHFLSNTLDTIKGIAIVNGNREIYDMTSALSRMLRYSIKGSNEVTLEEELKIVHSYVTIHQGRFPGRVAFESKLSDQLHQVIIPKMIIQPLVENALTHGLEPHVNGGKIMIKAEPYNKDYFEITVSDNGIGIERDQLLGIKQVLYTKGTTTNQHIGIKNVNDRIRMYYEGDYSIDIESSLGSGTIITIRLPFHSPKAT